MRSSLTALALLGLLSASCSGSPAPVPAPVPAPSRPCTEIGCFNRASFAAAMTAAEAAPGAHRFEIDVDGTTHVCTTPGTTTGDAVVTCDETVSLRFGQHSEMVEMAGPTPGTVGVRIEPTPGRFEWQLSIPGAPTQVHVVHTRDGVVVSDHAATPPYRDERPNGPGCDPVCRQAVVQW